MSRDQVLPSKEDLIRDPNLVHKQQTLILKTVFYLLDKDEGFEFLELMSFAVNFRPDYWTYAIGVLKRVYELQEDEELDDFKEMTLQVSDRIRRRSFQH